MKRLFLAAAIAALLLTLSAATTMAGPITVTFDASSLVQSATYNSAAIPTVGAGYISDGTNTYRTYGAVDGSSGFNSALAGWTAGEGISEFNLWLQNGTTAQASWWGENLSIADWNSISAAAPTGWTAAIVDAPASWGSLFTGHKLIAYYTTDSSLYLRPGQSAGRFSFTADLSEVIDPSVSYQIWVGAGYNNGNGAGDTNFSGTGGLVGGNYIGFQRAVLVDPDPVPEPATWTLLGLGLLGLGAKFRLRRS